MSGGPNVGTVGQVSDCHRGPFCSKRRPDDWAGNKCADFATAPEQGDNDRHSSGRICAYHDHRHGEDAITDD
jgi:hypothetical protein